MQTLLLAVGKLRPSLRQTCDDYLNRIRRYGPIEEREIREAGRAATPALRRREETARIAAALPSGFHPVVLDRGGAAWSSEELSRQVDRWRGQKQGVAVIVGGAFGIEVESLETPLTRWSLGPPTLSHELARLVALEQWYRAWTILRGEPYHK